MGKAIKAEKISSKKARKKLCGKSEDVHLFATLQMHNLLLACIFSQYSTRPPPSQEAAKEKRNVRLGTKKARPCGRAF
ncbi:MAG: hypothetical protein IJO10_10780 [Clostridia bacterium]|nr:hypothetical protein [Clostridia bacterium]